MQGSRACNDLKAWVLELSPAALLPLELMRRLGQLKQDCTSFKICVLMPAGNTHGTVGGISDMTTSEKTFGVFNSLGGEWRCLNSHSCKATSTLLATVEYEHPT